MSIKRRDRHAPTTAQTRAESEGEFRTLWDAFIEAQGVETRRLVVLLGSLIPIGLALFHLYTSYAGTLQPWLHRAIHLMGMLLVVFFSNNIKRMKDSGWKRGFPLIDLLWIGLILAVCVYMAFEYDQIIIRFAGPTTNDVIFGTILILLVLESSRRCVGTPVTALAALFLAYAYVGKFVPGVFGHKGFSYHRIIDQMFVQTFGIFGIPMDAAAVFIVIFIMFGAFLVKSGAGDFFIQLAYATSGRTRGGPAKTAVVASALMGTISGSGVANTVTTGLFTIPLMKKTGLRAEFAGAVEASASMGGALMPPIMSSAAFVIAEFTGTPYRMIMLHALLPALLFYFSIFMMIDLETLKTGVKTLPPGEIPRLRTVLAQGWQFLIPVLVLVALLTRGITPMKAGFYAIVLTVGLAAFKKETRMSFNDIISALELGIHNTAVVSITCAAAGILVGSISLSGLGVKFSGLLFSIAGNNLFLLFAFTMLSSLILGMGMPIVPAYIIVASLGVPALVSAGVPKIAAHMFVFYFAIVSGITPPVALCAYAAAGIAKVEPAKVALTALRLSAVAFLVPFMFGYDSRLLLMGASPLVLLRIIMTAFIGVYALACGLQGWFRSRLSLFERAAAVLAALMLVYPTWWSDLIGFGLLAIVLVVSLVRSRSRSAVQTVSR